MNPADRKPLAHVPPMESLIAKSVRLAPTEWDGVAVLARARALEPAVFVRTIIRAALSIAGVPGMQEASIGVLGATVGGALGFSQHLGVLAGARTQRRSRG
jgi:hypothetical protein